LSYAVDCSLYGAKERLGSVVNYGNYKRVLFNNKYEASTPMKTHNRLLAEKDPVKNPFPKSLQSLPFASSTTPTRPGISRRLEAQGLANL
jgi:hypothetical protein